MRNLFVGTVGALLIGLTSLGITSGTASAEVIENMWVDAVRSRDNPCEAGTQAIALTGKFHHVWYTTPDGTVKMNIQGHLKGTDPRDGTEYVFITQQHMEHWAWPVVRPYTDTVRLHLVSKGSTANALIVMTFDVPAGDTPIVPTTSATACVG